MNSKPFSNQRWRFIDQTTYGPQFQALQSFAYDDALCTAIGTADEADSVLRAWVHHDTVVLGIQDSRLPCIAEGVAYLKEQGYDVIVRNSGGLAVVLDDQVLNLSLLLKENHKISISHGYEVMVHLIESVLSSYSASIKAGEVIGSYCPGSYDLSIEGKKFAGISQRRIRGGVAVQIYISLATAHINRAELIKTFYEKATQGQPTAFDYPKINPNTMASLSELLDTDITVSTFVHQLLTSMLQLGAELIPSTLTDEEFKLYENQYARVMERNKKALQL